MGKGTRRERQARELYERAGYWVYSPQNPKYGDNDLWNLFDLACYRMPTQSLRFVQVKSNRASGITSWMETARNFSGVDGVTVDFAIVYDSQGWRVEQPTADGYERVLDERELDCAMGEGLVEFLSPSDE